MEQSGKSEAKQSRKRYLFRFLLVAFALLVCVVLAFPWLIVKTQLRDALINRIINTPHLSASSENGSLGWLSRASIDQLRLEGERSRIQINIDRIETDRPWPQLLAGAPNLGEFSIEHPSVYINLPLGFFEIPEPRISPIFTANIANAELEVDFDEYDESLIDIDQINLTAHVEDDGKNRALVLDPVQLFLERKLEPGHCSRLLQLVSPSMRYTTHAEGMYSLSLNKAKIPLGVDRDSFVDQIELAGELTLHQVVLDSDSPILQAVSRIVADAHGKIAPEKTRVAKDTTIAFEVRDGRLYHEGLEFGFPDIDPELLVKARGSVGMDESLDLYLEVPRLDKSKREAIAPVECRVTGTISNPVIAAQDASLVLRLPGKQKKLLEFEGVDIAARVIENERGRVLSFEPFGALDHQKLRRGVVGDLLKFLDPSFDLSPEVEGDVSMSIQSLEIPLGATDEELINEIRAIGQVSIHEFNSDVSAPLRQVIVKLVSDLYGKKPADIVRVAQDTVVDFELREARLHFKGLNMGFPDIDPALQISSSGSIGFDELIDVEMLVPRLNQAKQQDAGPVHCRVSGTIGEPHFSVTGASLVVQLPDREEPLLDVDDLDFSMRLVTTSKGKAISIDPIEVLKKHKLDRRLASGLLHLVDPEIKYSPQLTGHVSMSINQLIIPFEVNDQEFLNQIEMSGKLAIHDVSSIATSPLRHAIVKILADLNGKRVGDVVRVAHDTEVDFVLDEGQLRFEGMEIGFPDINPDIEISASGTIGLDESLDIHFQMPSPGGDSESAKDPIRCHVTGSLKRPRVSVSNASLAVHLQDDSEAVISLDKVEFQFEIEDEETTDFINFDPFVVFERQRLDTELCDGLLTLVAPTLEEVADVSGQISLSIDKFRVPLADKLRIINDTTLIGKLQLHEIKATSKTPLMTSLIKLLMDQYGKKPDGPVQVAKNAEIQFEFKGGRIHHHGFQFGLPGVSSDLVATSQGSVGLDRTLDLEINVPRFVMDGAAVPKVDHDNPILFQITGTIDKPVVTEVQD